MKQRQEEEKKILDSKYYPWEPLYIPNHREQPPTLVNNLTLALENPRDVQQDKRGKKTEEDRRIIMWILDKERDLDYYSDSESETDYEYQSYV